MATKHQLYVSEYHGAMAGGHHHAGHNMHLFHRDWHVQNRDPRPPIRPDANWGVNLAFGTAFLQMHHEMVRASATEPRLHMMHDSLAVWFQNTGKALPAEWDPLTTIPDELGYEPDLNEFPTEIQNGIRAGAARSGITPEQFLTRRTNSPRFVLPKWATGAGAGLGEPAEPITGARKLADFKNPNQLGCCLVFPHNAWHGAIGGAMGSTWTAIADPIFYFGVHWHIDKAFDEYKSIQAQREARPQGRRRLFELGALESEDRPVRNEFSSEERRTIEEFSLTSEKLNRPLL